MLTVLPRTYHTWYTKNMSKKIQKHVFYFWFGVFSTFSLLVLLFVSCSSPLAESEKSNQFLNTQEDLFQLLEKTPLTDEKNYAIINQIATNYRNEEMYNELILFLTDYVRKYPDDKYNAYWLLLTAHVYQQKGADPIAEMYFERIIKNYGDLSVGGKSIHILCLQNLVEISTSPENRIEYFNQLISHFPNEINKTEMYLRLAIEYEKLAEWKLALRAYSLFLQQEDAVSIQVVGVPDAYSRARRLVDFTNSPKDWTFESLEALESAVKHAVSNYQYFTLDRYKSKVNFFAMSWRQDAGDTNTQDNFSMNDFGAGNRIYYSTELDESSTPNEAYLRTWGWNSYLTVWYFYFRKVDFPLDPTIHGRWEWAGIYYGEKL